MPSAFIKSQAELLRRTQDTFLVLQNIRDKYAISSFPSQMSRVKLEWFKYGDRHDKFISAYNSSLKNLKSQKISSKYIKQYEEFGSDDIKEQIRKQSIAKKGNLTGSSRTDTAISQLKILPVYMDDYRLTPEDMEKNNDISSACLEKRSMNSIIVEDADNLIKKCQSIIKKLDDDTFMVVAAVAVVCGRRSVEILSLGEFFPSSKGKYAARFKGAAKKRGQCNEIIDIPLLVKYKYFEKAIKFIRTHINIEGLSNTEINSRYSHKLGDSSKILLESLNVKFHDLRAIYGTITHQAFKNSWSINIWLKKVLFHDSMDTSVFYSRCKISNCSEVFPEWKID